MGGSSDEPTVTPEPEPTATATFVPPTAVPTLVPPVTVVPPTEVVALAEVEVDVPVVSDTEEEGVPAIQLTIQPTPVRVEAPADNSLNMPALIGFIGSALMVLAAIGYVLFGRRS